HLLDDLNLLVARSHEHDVELVLLLGGGGPVAATGGCDRSSCSHGCGSGDAELLLEVLEQLAQLEDRHAGDGIEDLFLGGHYCSPCCSELSSEGGFAVSSGAGLSGRSMSDGGDSPSKSGGFSVSSGAGLTPGWSGRCTASALGSGSGSAGASRSTRPPCLSARARMP